MAMLVGKRQRVKSLRGDAGFSMVEVIAAMAVLAIVLLLLAVVQISALKAVADARRLQQATAFANEAVEQMRAIPWNTLSKGMYSDFLDASGGDPLVISGVLDVGEGSWPLIVAPVTNDQNLGNPARPLFDDTGSHVQVLEDPSHAGTEFLVKAYVTQAESGANPGIVGIVVVVEWTDGDGRSRMTTVRSEAYRGGVLGCGDADTQPFLAACQSFFSASAGSGNVTAEVSATNIDPNPALIHPVELLWPTASVEHSILMQTAGAAATMRSQQVNYADAYVQFGGNTLDDNIAITPATQQGFALHNLRATDDATNGSGWVPNPTPDLYISQLSSNEGEVHLSHSSSPVTLWARSDYGRPGTGDASMTTSCRTGIPDGQPCAIATVEHNGSSWDLGSGYMELTMDEGGPEEQVIRLSRRLSENAGAVNSDEAWVARFFSSAGSSAVGCMSVSGPGCVSAGATRTMAPLNLGNVVGGDWNGDAAEGMVVLQGISGTCDNYTESVMVQRGEGQTTTAPSYSRCGQLRYWNGTGYTPIPIDAGTSAVVDTAPVTWTSSGGTYTVAATSQVQIVPATVDNPSPADPNCESSACTVSVSAGTIIMVSVYQVSWGSQEYILYVSTTVTSPSAQASFSAAAHE